MKFCSNCGEKVAKRIPEGDDRPRYVCDSCDTVHYQNPKMVVGVLAVQDHQVLMCKRAIEPRKGFWTLPAGFMENGETTMAGAIRETWEEAYAKVSVPSLYRMFELPYINQVYIFYRANLLDETYSAGPESLDVQLFNEDEIPWKEIAFPIVTEILREHFEDTRNNEYPVRISEVDPLWQRKSPRTTPE